MANLEEKLNAEFSNLKIEAKHQQSILRHLNKLKEADKLTYEHSIRVSLLAARIAKFTHQDEKALLYAGAFHDIGKIFVPRHLLKKRSGFDEKDYDKIKDHVKYGYEMVKDLYPFSAEILVRHHSFQDNSYPKKLPVPKINFSEKSMAKINFYARLLSIADFYDALRYRNNDKFKNGNNSLTIKEMEKIMIEANPDYTQFIQELFSNRVIADNEDISGDDFEKQYNIHKEITAKKENKRTPSEIRRQIEIACVLEPLSEKTGCTTRSTDISPHLKLEYLQIAGINIGPSFEELANRILKNNGTPELTYDLALRAQQDSKLNRYGGRVNQGIIEMLFPLVASQAINDPFYELSIDDTISNAVKFLKTTTRNDVNYLVEMKKLAYEMSRYENRTVPLHNDAKNVFEYYQKDLMISEKNTSILHNEEFVMGFPVIKAIYDVILNSSEKIFNRKIKEAYNFARIKHHNYDDVGPGLTADCVAAAIYLILSHHSKDMIIQ